jgi:uncharacterized repeat protein (TIGR03843 family)
MPHQSWLPDRPDIIEVLAEARPEEAFILTAGSNRVYLLRMTHSRAGEGYAVYKPLRGEAPLSDFPDGTLYKREYGAYLVSEALGWGLVPPTILREDGLDGGVGMLQVFIEHDPAENYFSLKDTREADMKRVAVFDWLTNNADRKGGHFLLAADSRIWCIDQGLTFNVDEKLRTVVWDFKGQQPPAELVADVSRFCERLETDGGLRDQLSELMTAAESAKLRQRAQVIAGGAPFPYPPAYRPYPWPLV